MNILVEESRSNAELNSSDKQFRELAECVALLLETCLLSILACSVLKDEAIDFHRNENQQWDSSFTVKNSSVASHSEYLESSSIPSFDITCSGFMTNNILTGWLSS